MVGALVCFAGCAGPKGSDADGPDDPSATSPASSVAGEASCTAVLPSGCSVAPSYAATIEPLVQRACATCHGPGGVASDRDLTTYANVARLEITELIQIYACQMPPADAGADAMLSSDERQEMMQWFVCGYPDN